MINIIKYLFLFLSGAILGWGIEVVYRRYLGKARKWINPGFLSGPYLPLYGTGVCILYFISDVSVGLPIKIILFCVSTTLIELLTGLFFLNYYKVRLWDYTKLKLNYKGMIAPLYSFFWTVLSLIFYYVLYPYFYEKIEFLYKNLEFSLFIGMFYGVVFVDMINSFNVIHKIKTAIESSDFKQHVIHLEQIKEEFKAKIVEAKDKALKPHYFMPFKRNFIIKEHIQLSIKQKKNNR